MYRLVLYLAIFLLTVAAILAYFNFFSYSPLAIIFTALYITSVCYLTNHLFSFVYQVPGNVESFFITALILALIVPPISTPHGLFMVSWVAVLSIALKFILAIHKKHIFNPAAIALVFSAMFLNFPATWWVGTKVMAPFVAVAALLIVRKIRRGDLFLSFSAAALFIEAIFIIQNHGQILTALPNYVLRTSFLFFAGFMLTEPLTTPPTRNMQILYGLLVGSLFVPQIHIGPLYTTPEIALVIGNIFSFIVSPKAKAVLFLKEKIALAPDLTEFIFAKPPDFAYQPGQYMEWTLPHPHTDSRGNRRYFTLASSPSEDSLRLGIKFNSPGSSFKNFFHTLDAHSPLVAAQVSGDFILPKDSSQKLVYIAGGIGITPFRSHIKYLLDTHQKRDIILLYFAKDESEFVFKDVFSQAEKEMSLIVHYQLHRLDPEQLKTLVPDYKDRLFYLSGPRGLVTGFEQILASSGVPASHIKTDYFPGFA